MSGILWLLRPEGLRQRLQSLDEVNARLHRLEQSNGHAAADVLQALSTLQGQAGQAHWARAGDLRAFERRVHAQNGEDGILEEILNRIGTTTRTFVEFGVESGAECNCARLANELGWEGLFLEANDVHFKNLAVRYREYPKVRCVQAKVTTANIESLLAASDVPTEFDVLSIDIDGNDYWVWASICRWRPRVVIIEYNASYPPPRKWVMKEDQNCRWNGTNYHGASLASLTALGRVKGYTLVSTNSTGINAFFVRDELATQDKFLDPVVQYHYSPPGFGSYLGGHPPGSGPYVEV
jgi:hypothetical protein